MPGNIALTASGYATEFFGVTDPLGQGADVVGAVVQGTATDNPYFRGYPSSIGLELCARRRLTGRIGGLVSYTLSRTTTSFQVAKLASPLDTPTQFDRAHVLNVATLYDLGRGLQGGTRILFYTGTPERTLKGAEPYGFLRAAGRWPPFLRFDARLSKRWSLGGTRHVSAVLEVQNAFFATEAVQTSSCAPRTCTLGPITLPNLGVEAGF